MRVLLCFVVVLLAVPRPAAAEELSCGWRGLAKAAPDNPHGDPGPPWYPGERLTDAAWRALADHYEQYHHGLWTAAEVEALERAGGVQLAVMQPLPDSFDTDGTPLPSAEAGVVQWPERVQPRSVFLVAVGSAEPAEDWVFAPVEVVEDGGGPPVAGPTSATVAPAHQGFFRVHRVYGAAASAGKRTLLRAERVDVNPLGIHTDLRLTTDAVRLPLDQTGTAFNIVASGSYTVRSADYDSLPAPIVVNLSLVGPGADLFTLQTLPAGGEPARTTARNVRVSDRVDFRILASPGAVVGSALLDQVLPPGQSLELSVRAVVVSFANPTGPDLDEGLAGVGFSVAPGVPVVFPPARQLPADTAHRRLALTIFRDPAGAE